MVANHISWTTCLPRTVSRSSHIHAHAHTCSCRARRWRRTDEGAVFLPERLFDVHGLHFISSSFLLPRYQARHHNFPIVTRFDPRSYLLWPYITCTSDVASHEETGHLAGQYRCRGPLLCCSLVELTDGRNWIWTVLSPGLTEGAIV